MPVLMQSVRGYAGTMVEGLARKDRSFVATENANHRTDHAVVGALTARVWRLAPEPGAPHGHARGRARRPHPGRGHAGRTARPGARTRWTTALRRPVLMPGLVEGHSHLMAGTLWRYAYCGWFDVHATRRAACGRALKSLDAVVAGAGRGAAAAPATARSSAGASTRSTSAPALQPRRPGPRQQHARRWA
jgi:hypothetical protein